VVVRHAAPFLWVDSVWLMAAPHLHRSLPRRPSHPRIPPYLRSAPLQHLPPQLWSPRMSGQGQLALTFDLDVESVWLAASPDYERRLSTLSEARYGVGRGLTRILDLLGRYEAIATFY